MLPATTPKKRGNPFIGHTPKTRRTNGTNSLIGDALHNDFEPQFQYVHESPRHRLITHLAATGLSKGEIAKTVGVTRQTVQNTVRQPWARERIVSEIKKTVQDELKATLEGVAQGALLRMVDLSMAAESEQVRLAANREILDRYLGKPTQVVEQKTVVDPKSLTDEELAKLIDISTSSADASGTTPDSGVASGVGS